MFGNMTIKTGLIAPIYGTLKTPDMGSKEREINQ